MILVARTTSGHEILTSRQIRSPSEIANRFRQLAFPGKLHLWQNPPANQKGAPLTIL
jgi:hypothetical protein